MVHWSTRGTIATGYWLLLSCQKVSKLLFLFVSLILELRFLTELFGKAGDGYFFSLKGQLVNILVFAGPMISAVTTQLCCRRVKETIDNIQINGLF